MIRIRWIVSLIILAGWGAVAPAEAWAGLVFGPAARTQFEGFRDGPTADTFVDFNSFPAGTALSTQVSGVTFQSNIDTGGNPFGPINVYVSTAPQCTVRCIVGTPFTGGSDDGRVGYQILFTSPQRRAGLLRIWNQFTVTRFYNASNQLLAEHTGTSFVGFIADGANSSTDWVARIQIDGLLEQPGNTTRQVGYSDDLFFGSVADTQAPTVAGGPVATAAGSSRINLAWTAAIDDTGVALYQVFRDGIFRATVNAPSTSFLDTGLASSTLYAYRVAACDATANCSAQSAQASATTAAPPALQVAAGVNHTVALKSEGTLWAWGENRFGRLGSGTADLLDHPDPVQVGTATNWAAVAAGTHTVALKGDGTLWTWGQNNVGQLGDGSTTDRLSPVQVDTATNWAAVATGEIHTLALKSNGTLWAWGYNSTGQLGDNSLTERHSPVQVGTATDWAAMAAGISHSVALKKNGTLWAWGYNLFGQLGDGTTTQRLSPVQIGTQTNWVAVAAGQNHTLALKSDGTLWAWGRNNNGQLGDGTTTQRLSPVQIGTETNWAAVEGGDARTVALKTDGTLWAWGLNLYGELGDGTTTQRLSPVQVGTATNWVAVAAGAYHTVALKSDGTLWAWGYNGNGRLGDGTTTNRLSPTAVLVGSTSFTANLEPGFNLIGNSLNVTLSIAATFGNQDAQVAGVTPNIVSIWKWNAVDGRWAFYSPQLTVAGINTFAAGKGYDVLAAINPGEGYWVNTISQFALPAQTGSDFSWSGANFSTLPSGFSLIAHATSVTPSQFNAQVSITPPGVGVIPTDNFVTLWAWDAVAGNWYFYSPLLESSGGLAAVKSYADGKFFRHFQDYSKTLGVGVGFWVNRP